MSTSTSKVERTAEGNFWYEYRPGRRRFISATSEMGQHLQRGLDLSIIEARTHAVGTFEAVEYYRDPNGKVGIPPQPGAPLAPGCTRLTANSLAEIDNLTREMNIEDARRFSDDGSFNEHAQVMLGDPRGELKRRLSQTRSNLERDTIRLMLEQGEEEDRARRTFTGHSFFHQREFDR